MPDIAQGGLPNAPTPASYQSPVVDFSPLANLANKYFEGTQQRRTLALQSAFENGVPTRPDGSIDYAAMSKTLAKYGDTGLAQAGMPKFGQISEGFLGDKQFGSFDPLTSTVRPAISQRPMRPPAGTLASSVGC